MPLELAALLPLLTGAVARIADGTLEKIGGDLYNRTKAFFDKLHGATIGSADDAKVLRSFEKLPADYQSEMRALLERHLKDNFALQDAAKQFLGDKDAPRLLVRLEATDADHQLGVRKLELTRGTADISVKADRVKDQGGLDEVNMG